MDNKSIHVRYYFLCDLIEKPPGCFPDILATRILLIDLECYKVKGTPHML